MSHDSINPLTKDSLTPNHRHLGIGPIRAAPSLLLSMIVFGFFQFYLTNTKRALNTRLGLVLGIRKDSVPLQGADGLLRLAGKCLESL